MYQNYWMGVDGTFYLKGVVGDPLNPIRLSDEVISAIMATTPIARTDAAVAMPALLPAEQTRIQALLDAGPTPDDLLALMEDSQRFQRQMNSMPTRYPCVT